MSRIGTQLAHLGADFLDSVEHEGGGWYPTLEVGGGGPNMAGMDGR